MLRGIIKPNTKRKVIQLNTKEEALEFLKDDDNFFAFMYDENRENDEVKIEVKKELWSDPEFVLEMLKNHENRNNGTLILKKVSSKLRSDHDFMLKAIEIDSVAFWYAENKLFANSKYLLDAIKICPFMLKDNLKTIQGIRKNKEQIMELFKENGDVGKYMEEKLKWDRNFLLDLIKANPKGSLEIPFSKKDLSNPKFNAFLKQLCKYKDKDASFELIYTDREMFLDDRYAVKLCYLNDEIKNNNGKIYFVEEINERGSLLGSKSKEAITSFRKTTFEETIEANQIIVNMANKINRIAKEKNLSPFEKYLLCFRVVNAIEYSEKDDDYFKDNYLKSQSFIETILSNKGICVGKAEYLRNLLNLVGINACEVGINSILKTKIKTNDLRRVLDLKTEHIPETEEFLAMLDELCKGLGDPSKIKNTDHSTNLIYLEDEKYGISGIFEGDPTWGDKYAITSLSQEDVLFLFKGKETFNHEREREQISQMIEEASKGREVEKNKQRTNSTKNSPSLISNNQSISLQTRLAMSKLAQPLSDLKLKDALDLVNKIYEEEFKYEENLASKPVVKNLNTETLATPARLESRDLSELSLLTDLDESKGISKHNKTKE